MKRVPVRFAQFIYALMWVAGVAWAASGEVLGGSALILASASGLIAPVGRELDSKKTSIRGVASILLLIAAVAAISADVLL